MVGDLISIIVPVYNVEEYLAKCIDSILHQTYTNLEIILVDDGSPDGCPQICDEYAKKDNRIVVIHKKNGGVSSARNAGLDICKGQYVAFVDSDDWICNTYIEKLILELKKSDCELVQCNYFYVKGEEIVAKNKPRHKELYNATLEKDFFQIYENVLTPAIWDKLFVRKCILKKFDEDLIYGEDDVFILNYLKNIKKIKILDDCLYYYVDNENGCLNNKVYNKMFDRLQMLQDMRERLICELGFANKAVASLNMSNVRQMVIPLTLNVKNNKKYSVFCKEFCCIRNEKNFIEWLKRSKPRNLKEFVVFCLFKYRLKIMLYYILKRR